MGLRTRPQTDKERKAAIFAYHKKTGKFPTYDVDRVLAFWFNQYRTWQSKTYDQAFVDRVLKLGGPKPRLTPPPPKEAPTSASLEADKHRILEAFAFTGEWPQEREERERFAYLRHKDKAFREKVRELGYTYTREATGPDEVLKFIKRYKRLPKLTRQNGTERRIADHYRHFALPSGRGYTVKFAEEVAAALAEALVSAQD